MDNGKVYIVGAGPGDPGLITVRGMELIRQADVIVYDRLISEALLKEARPSAEMIYVGKRPGFHPVPQEKINEILIDLGRRNLKIVRLKGGDPFIFGRGAEECLTLKSENIDFEVVPGLTSALGASAYAGIPLTHRNTVVQIMFITAHESKDKSMPQVDWAQIARLRNTTLVIYMGVSQLDSITASLIDSGRCAGEPVSIVENATLPGQRVVITSLGRAAVDARQNNIVPPSLIIVSPLVDFHEDLDWFDKSSAHNDMMVPAEEMFI